MWTSVHSGVKSIGRLRLHRKARDEMWHAGAEWRGFWEEMWGGFGWGQKSHQQQYMTCLSDWKAFVDFSFLVSCLDSNTHTSGWIIYLQCTNDPFSQPGGLSDTLFVSLPISENLLSAWISFTPRSSIHSLNSLHINNSPETRLTTVCQLESNLKP